MTVQPDSTALRPAPDGAIVGRTGVGPWHALWTHSHCEQLVHDQLTEKGFSVFLPTMSVWSRRGGVRRLIQTPMFPGYLFLRDAMDKAAYLEVRKTRGLVRVLGERWDRLAAIPDGEMDAVVKVVMSRRRVLPYPYLREGQRVRVTDGPLAGVHGVLVESQPERGLLVLSIHMLQRSVAVVLDATDVAPV
jgi:transcription antitermination factor NusG